MAGELPLSVILPVRNGEATVGRAIESCLDQTRNDFELILVDDGSTDGTSAILKSAASRHPEMVCLRTSASRGVAAAFACGLERARGRRVARMDADDLCEARRFERQMAFLDANPEMAGCGSGVRIRVEDGSPEGGEPADGFRDYERWINDLHEPEKIAAERFVESPIVNPTMMLRREVLDAVGGYQEDLAWAEDYDLWLRLLERGERLGNVPEVLLEWRDSPGRLTRSHGHYSHEAFQRAKAHYLARLPAVRERGVVVCGAGPIGKRLARFLREEGVALNCFVDVHPRRVGERIGGAPVLGTEEVPGPGEAVALGAVGLSGGRDRVRELVFEKGFREGEDFFCVA